MAPMKVTDQPDTGPTNGPTLNEQANELTALPSTAGERWGCQCSHSLVALIQQSSIGIVTAAAVGCRI